MTNQANEKFVVWNMESTGVLNITNAKYGSNLAIGEHDVMWNVVMFRGSLGECKAFMEANS